MAICKIHQVTKTYGRGAAEVHAVKGVSLSIDAGEFTAFVGPSGSGKTTLLNQVGCLDRPTSGTIHIDGTPTGDLGDQALSKLRGDKIGFIFQSYNLIPVSTALKNAGPVSSVVGNNNASPLLGRWSSVPPWSSPMNPPPISIPKPEPKPSS